MTDETRKQILDALKQCDFVEEQISGDTHVGYLNTKPLEDFIDTALTAERERLVSEIEKRMKEHTEYHMDDAFWEAKAILNLINPSPTFATAPTFETLQEAVDSGEKFAVVGNNPFQPSN